MANITITGCVIWDTGDQNNKKIKFDYEIDGCAACDSIYKTACIETEGAHAGQVKLTSFGGLCDDSYYGCVDPVTKLFEVTIPEDCAVPPLSLRFEGLEDRDCYVSSYKMCSCFVGIADILNGNIYTLPNIGDCEFELLVSGNGDLLGDYKVNEMPTVETTCDGTEETADPYTHHEYVIAYVINAVLTATGIDITITARTVVSLIPNGPLPDESPPVYVPEGISTSGSCDYDPDHFYYGYDDNGYISYCDTDGTWRNNGTLREYIIANAELTYGEGETCATITTTGSVVEPIAMLSTGGTISVVY